LSNIIFLLGHNEKVSQNTTEGIIRYLGSNHPSRFFIVQIDDSTENSVDTKIVSRTILNSSGQTIQTEELYISIHANSLHKVSNIILSQLVPDIDVVVVESESFGSINEEFLLRNKIVEIADVYVSKGANSSVKSFRGLNEKCSFRSWSFPFVSKWCSAISEQFDSDHVLNSLNELNEIVITYSDDACETAKIKTIEDFENLFPPDLVYLVSWLKECLGIKVSGIANTQSGRLALTCESISDAYVKAPITIILTRENVSHTALNISILGVCFVMGSGESTLKVECKYIKSSSAIEVSIESPRHLDNSSNDFCEFNLRRIPAHFFSAEESLLIAIRNQPINCSI
jgi:hypothetical protein